MKLFGIDITEPLITVIIGLIGATFAYVFALSRSRKEFALKAGIDLYINALKEITEIEANILVVKTELQEIISGSGDINDITDMLIKRLLSFSDEVIKKVGKILLVYDVKNSQIALNTLIVSLELITVEFDKFKNANTVLELKEMYNNSICLECFIKVTDKYRGIVERRLNIIVNQALVDKIKIRWFYFCNYINNWKKSD